MLKSVLKRKTMYISNISNKINFPSNFSTFFKIIQFLTGLARLYKNLYKEVYKNVNNSMIPSLTSFLCLFFMVQT